MTPVPRPRFHTLARERQEAILNAALDEFSTHGFTTASPNRIITAIGRVMDSWAIAEAPDPLDYAAAVHTILGILRRAVQPW